MTTYQMGTASTNLADVKTTLGVDPQGTYAPGGEREAALDGTLKYRGFPRATWTFAALTLARWTTLKNTLASGGLSGTCYIRTRNDVDTWTVWQAISRLPYTEGLKRWGGRYLDVKIEFLLVTVVT